MHTWMTLRYFDEPNLRGTTAAAHVQIAVGGPFRAIIVLSVATKPPLFLFFLFFVILQPRAEAGGGVTKH